MAATLDAASRLFAEKSSDAVTMTAVAERSKTAIGQLSRFFPTKDVLADAVLLQYRQRLDQDPGRLAEDAARCPPAGLADVLLSLMAGLGEHRTAARMLLDLRADSSDHRDAIRGRMLSRLREILAAIRPRPDAPPRDGAAGVLLQLLKLAAANPAPGPGFQAAIRIALAAYLSDLMAVPDA